MRTLRLLALGAAVAAAAALVACGDDDTPGVLTPPETVVTPPVRTQPTPFPTPRVEGSSLSSDGKGYRATVPESWNIHANLINTADATADVFFAPLESPEAQAQASIAVNCIFARGGDDASRVEFLATNTARIGLHHDITMSEREVAGFTATVLTYRFQSQETPEQALDKQDIIITGENCDWVITLSAPLGRFDAYRADFDTFLNSFEEFEPQA